MPDDEKHRLLSDFSRTDFARAKDGDDEILFVSEKFDAAYANMIECADEVEYNTKLFENEYTPEIFSHADTEEDKRGVFKCGLVNQIISEEAAIITDVKPRKYVDPIFVENFHTVFLDWVLSQNLDQEVKRELVELGVIAVDERGMINPDGINVPLAKEYLNKTLDDLFDWWRESRRLKTKAYLAVIHGGLAGKAWFRMFTQENRGRLDIELEVHSRLNVAEDPNAITRSGRKELYFVEKLHVREIENMFGLSKGSIQPDSRVSKKSDGWQPGDSAFKKYEDPKARLVTMYARDESLEEAEDGFEIPAYPFGREITFVCGQEEYAGGIKILKDRAYMYPMWPLVDYIPNPVTEIDGIPTARNVAPFEELRNEAVQLAVENFRATGSDRILHEDNAFHPEEEANLNDEPGQRIRVQDLQAIHYQAATPSIEPGLAMAQFMLGGARDQTSIHETSSGKRQGEISGRAIENLQEGTNRRIRPRARFFEEAYREVAQLWAYMALDVYKVGHPYRAGEQFKTLRRLPFNLSDFMVDAEVVIGEDSSVPKDKGFLAQLYMDLAKTPDEHGFPMMDSETIFEILEVPDKEKIRRRRDESRAMMQQMQQLQQQNEEAMGMIEQLQQQVEQAGEENLTLRIKAAGVDSRAQIATMSEQLKVVREQMRSDSTKQTEQIKGVYSLIKERIKQE